MNKGVGHKNLPVHHFMSIIYVLYKQLTIDLLQKSFNSITVTETQNKCFTEFIDLKGNIPAQESFTER